MSLILEALKKSEAERRRGQSPDLFGATLGTPPPRREIPRVWPLLVLGLILLASAWMIWSGGSRGEPVPPPESPVAEAVSAINSDVRPAPSNPSPAPVMPTRQAPLTAGTKPAAKPLPPEVPQVPTAFVPAPTASAEPAPPPEEALPTLSALDAGSRAALPPLKLSMHVYADEPGKRFAIIDGQRIGEGALLAGGVVESIRRDGVVININGRRLLLPKP
jgi:general secretion pathway protein B